MSSKRTTPKAFTPADDVQLVERWVDGQRLREIAAALGFSITGVGSRIGRLRKLGVKLPNAAERAKTRVPVAALNALIAKKKRSAK